LSMATVASADIASAASKTLPKYPMPVALIGRLAVDHRARGRRLGEQLLIDALHRVVDAAEIICCLGIIVDAKDEDAERFYTKYDFVTVAAVAWPHRMFLRIEVARAAFSEP
jgi:predicted GNAT family N-acyltransferase